MSERGFHRWRHRAQGAERHVVFPDGCRDVLVLRAPDGPVRVLLTPFDLMPRHAGIAPGTVITGYRLRPGAVLSAATMAALAAVPGQAAAILGETCGGWDDLDEAIRALTMPDARVEAVARDAGVQLRTMQRHFRARGLPPPDFWRLLARARRAAGMLASAEPLAGIAAECGFADQAHMTRDLMRWFGAPPARLRRNAAVLALLRQPALGNWTGEQSSTR